MSEYTNRVVVSGRNIGDALSKINNKYNDFKFIRYKEVKEDFDNDISKGDWNDF
jgi:hypothetical protein